MTQQEHLGAVELDRLYRGGFEPSESIFNLIAEIWAAGRDLNFFVQEFPGHTNAPKGRASDT